MKKTWRKPAGLIYLPVHPAGKVATVLAVIFLIPVYSAVMRTGHFASGNLYQLFIYTTCTAFWRKRIAEKTSN